MRFSCAASLVKPTKWGDPENGRNSALVARSTKGLLSLGVIGALAGLHQFVAAARSRENERGRRLGVQLA
jgi:hypothetical protein